MEFKYIKERYNVPAAINREVNVSGKKGVITKDMGNYIGVNFYDKITVDPVPCHPTWEVEYLDTFSHKVPIKKQTASQKRYAEYLHSERCYSFREWLGIKDKKRFNQLSK